MKRKKTLLCILMVTVFLVPLMGNTAVAADVTYYFDDYDTNTAWETNPGNMVDGSENTHAKTTIDGDVQLLTSNTYPGTPPGVGEINIVELSVKAFSDIPTGNYVNLTPVFGGTSDGDEHPYPLGTADTWSDWFDITTDTNAPERWTWDDIANLDCKVIAGVRGGSYVNCSKVQIRVTYG